MAIQLKFTLTLQDYLEAQRLHTKRGCWPRLGWALAYTVIPVFGILWVVSTFFQFRIKDSPGLFAFEVAVGLFLACYPLYLRLRWKRCYLRTRPEQDECTVEFDDSIIRIRSATMSTEVQWQAVRSYSENKKLFLLYLAPAKFIAIPKRICLEPEIDELRRLFTHEIGAVHQ